MKFTKAFSGVVDGDVYPTEFKKGQDCPRELEAAAKDAGAVGGKSTKNAESEEEAETEEEGADTSEAADADGDAGGASDTDAAAAVPAAA